METATAPAPAEGQAPADGGEVKEVEAPVSTPEVAPEAPAPSAWYDGAADEVVGYIQNKGWAENPLGAVEAYQNLEKFHGVPSEQIVKLPKDMQDDEAMSEIYSRLGRPEAPDGYGEFEAPEGVELDESRMSWADEMAHSLGLNKQQRDAMIAKTLEYENAQMGEFRQALTAAQENEIAELQKEIGPAFEEYSEIAARAAKHLGLETIAQEIENKEGSAKMIKAMHEVGTKMLEADVVTDASGNVKLGTPTIQQAKAEKASLINEIGRDQNRMSLFDKREGKDFDRVQYLNSIINAAELQR